MRTESEFRREVEGVAKGLRNIAVLVAAVMLALICIVLEVDFNFILGVATICLFWWLIFWLADKSFKN